jgi:pilus assembly protein Flp/PilA
MNDMLLKLYVKSQELINREEGQDLVEYALLIALVALGSITAIGYVTTALSKVFTGISNSI